MELEQYERGDVVTVKVAVGERRVTRPAVVVSDGAYHRHLGEALVAPLVTEAGRLEEEWLHRMEDWQTTGTGRPGFVVRMLRVVDGAELERKCGALSSRDREAVELQMAAVVAYGTGARRRPVEPEEPGQGESDPGPGWRKWSLRLRSGQAPVEVQGSKLWKQKNGAGRLRIFPPADDPRASRSRTPAPPALCKGPPHPRVGRYLSLRKDNTELHEMTQRSGCRGF